jgi:hypothetical protein
MVRSFLQSGILNIISFPSFPVRPMADCDYCESHRAFSLCKSCFMKKKMLPLLHSVFTMLAIITWPYLPGVCVCLCVCVSWVLQPCFFPNSLRIFWRTPSAQRQLLSNIFEALGCKIKQIPPTNQTINQTTNKQTNKNQVKSTNHFLKCAKILWSDTNYTKEDAEISRKLWTLFNIVSHWRNRNQS